MSLHRSHSPLRDRLEARLGEIAVPEASAPRRASERCWLAEHGLMEMGGPMPACVGRLIRMHLIPQQVLKREGAPIWDERVWRWACGGRDYGNAGHHGMKDATRQLRVPRSSIPEETERFAQEFGLLWYLAREYGRRQS